MDLYSEVRVRVMVKRGGFIPRGPTKTNINGRPANYDIATNINIGHKGYKRLCTPLIGLVWPNSHLRVSIEATPPFVW